MNNRLLWKTIFQYKHNNIFFRNMILVFLLVCIPLSALTIIFSVYYNKNFEQNMLIYYNSKMDEISNQFNDFINITNSNYNAISANYNFINWLNTAEYTESTTQAMDIYEITKQLSMSSLNIPHLDSIYLYKKSTDYVFSLNKANTLERFDDVSWYGKFVNNQNKDFIYSRNFKGIDYVTICRIVAANGDSFGGLIVFNFRADEFRKIFLADSNSAKIKITSQAGNTVFSDMDNSKDGSRGRLTLERDCIESFYHISVQFDFSAFSEQKKLSSISIVLSIIFAIIATIFISCYISMKFYASLFKIINIFRNEFGDTDDIPVEVNSIINNVLQLKEKNAQIEEVLSQKISALNRSQILTLQEQINPHFIFNALNVISMTDMAEHKKQTNITKIIKLLSDILKGVLDTESYTCSFRQELEYVDKYVQLQNIKFDNHIKFEKNIDENVKYLSCVKFMLQPIIENAIEHGIMHNPDGYGTITLKAYIENNSFKIVISDDGPGIPSPKVLELEKSLKSSTMSHKKHIGIANVHKRIQLIYGENYGLKIVPCEHGAKIEYTLPNSVYKD